MNSKAIEYAVKLGLALHCTILSSIIILPVKLFLSRSAERIPGIATYHSYLQKRSVITVGETERNIRLNRIHIEEDAGKSLHDVDENYTSIDLNRAGVASEIVVNPTSTAAMKRLPTLPN